MIARRLVSGLAAVLALLLAAGTGYAWHLGYLGGPVYTLVPARAPGDGTVAVFFSGDMGFNTGMGPKIAGHLADAGIPVVGVNSLTAFAHRRTPAQAEALVAAAVARAAAIPGARRVLLIGQSFGANIVLAGAGTLPPRLRDRVAMVDLIVPGAQMLFRATPGGTLDTESDGAALPYAQALTHERVLCIHGDGEAGSLCPLWRGPNVDRVTLPGDHFLHRDSALVAATVLRALDAGR